LSLSLSLHPFSSSLSRSPTRPLSLIRRKPFSIALSLSSPTLSLSSPTLSLFEVYTNRCSLPSLPSQRGPPVSASDGNQLSLLCVHPKEVLLVNYFGFSFSFPVCSWYY
ncbi:unnamed protein product, partial [Brassica rapa]